MHKIGICHRDLKPENMLLDYKKDLKIIDFGLSNLYKKNEKLKTACGSPGYAAPEMIKGEEYNGLLSDLWSIGIILYVMIIGCLPFDDPNENALYEKIIAGKFSIPKHVSPLASDLIRKILVCDPNKRISIKDIRNHQWYNMCSLPKIEGLFISIQPIPVDPFIIETMKQFGYDKEEVTKLLTKNKHNNITTLYYLIIKKNMKKGIGSVSDLISKQFMSYISKHNTKNQSPQYLVLTKSDSTIITQNQIVNYKTFHINKDIETINNTINYDNVRTNFTINNIPIMNQYQNHTINELNEYCTKKSKSKGDLNEKIENFRKLVRKMPFKMKKENEHSMRNQLRTQYDSYIKKAWQKKKTGFNKGFLQTSTSFHKGEKIKANRTFTLDDKDDTINNETEKKKLVLKYSTREKKRKFLSLPKQKNKYMINTQLTSNNILLNTYRNRASSSSKEKRILKSNLTHNAHSIEKTNSNNSNNNYSIQKMFKKFKRGSMDFNTNIKNRIHNKNKSETYRSTYTNTTNATTNRTNRKKNISTEQKKLTISKNDNPFSKLKPPNRRNLKVFLVGTMKTSRGECHSRNANNIFSFNSTDKAYL